MPDSNQKNPISLDMNDAVRVWLYSWDGEYQHAIAARFGVNQGRISEILSGKKFSESRKIAEARRGVA